MQEKLKPVGIFLAVVASGILIYFLVHGLSGSYLSNKKEGNGGIQCSGSHASHQVTIQNNQISPQHTDGKLCDTLMITNKDNRIRLIAFGQHDEHQPYDDVEEKALKQNESLTVTLNQAGSFLFHDHFQDEAKGTFTVR